MVDLSTSWLLAQRQRRLRRRGAAQHMVPFGVQLFGPGQEFLPTWAKVGKQKVTKKWWYDVYI
jgi:hypothetical protein